MIQINLVIRFDPIRSAAEAGDEAGLSERWYEYRAAAANESVETPKWAYAFPAHNFFEQALYRLTMYENQVGAPLLRRFSPHK